MNETDLISGLLKNDENAFRNLVEKYQDQVYRTSFGLVNNSEDAEDIAQDVFIEVFQSLRKFRGDAQLSTWIYRITVNKSINLLRKNKRKEWFIPIENLLNRKKNNTTELSFLTHTSDNDLVSVERNNLLNQAIASLPENQRIAFTLHKIEDLPHKEIARIMKNSVSSVESLIFRAKNNLQKKLAAYYKNR